MEASLQVAEQKSTGEGMGTIKKRFGRERGKYETDVRLPREYCCRSAAKSNIAPPFTVEEDGVGNVS